MSDASYGVVTVGRLVLRETFGVKSDVNAGNGIRTVTIEGEESYPPLTLAQLRQRTEDIMTMRDMVLPITFTNKSDWDGLYEVDDVSTEHTDYIQGVKATKWSIRARRVGPTNSAEIESRLTGITRQNDFGKTGTLWHAPAVGHHSYYTGSTRPGTFLDRPSEDGDVRVFYPIPAGVSPRWSVTPQNYRLGRARIKVDGLERTGTNMKDGATWELGNGIIRATPAASGGIDLGFWNGSTYDTKTWNVSVGASATPIGDFQAMSVLRNDFEMATIRLVKNMTPMGRSVLDLSIRRGSRFVEGYLQTDVAATLAVGLAVAENGTAPASGGYVVASANDSAGNKAIVGTARNFTAQTSRVGVQKNNAIDMDFWISAEYAGDPQTNTGAEAGTTGWIGNSAGIASSNEQAKFGNSSFKMTALGSPFPSISGASYVPVIPGKQYRLSAWVFASVDPGVNAFVDIMWQTSAGVLITESVLNSPVTVGAWKLIEVTATAPATAARARRFVGLAGTPVNGVVVYIDEPRLQPVLESGDLAPALRDQYIGSLAEMTMAVLR